MFLIKDSTAALLGGAALVGVSVQQVFDGTSFRTPGFSQAELMGFWLPLTGAVLLLAPKVIPGLSAGQKRLVGAGILLFVGGRRLLSPGGTAFTLDNAFQSYLPALAGVALVA